MGSSAGSMEGRRSWLSGQGPMERVGRSKRRFCTCVSMGVCSGHVGGQPPSQRAEWAAGVTVTSAQQQRGCWEQSAETGGGQTRRDRKLKRRAKQSSNRQLAVMVVPLEPVKLPAYRRHRRPQSASTHTAFPPKGDAAHTGGLQHVHHVPYGSAVTGRAELAGRTARGRASGMNSDARADVMTPVEGPSSIVGALYRSWSLRNQKSSCQAANDGRCAGSPGGWVGGCSPRVTRPGSAALNSDERTALTHQLLGAEGATARARGDEREEGRRRRSAGARERGAAHRTRGQRRAVIGWTRLQACNLPWAPSRCEWAPQRTLLPSKPGDAQDRHRAPSVRSASSSLLLR